MATGHGDRTRKIITAAVAAVLFVAPFLVTSAGSASITQPVSVTTTVDGVAGGTATAGKPATVDFTVTNRATNGAKLGVVTIVAPKGLTSIAKVGTSSPQWTETLLGCGSTPRCSALVFASAARKAVFLPPGASITVTVRLTPTSAGTLAFPVLGVGTGVFTTTSTPTITVKDPTTPVATGLRITSITEAGSPIPILHAGQTFDVAFEVVDAAGNIVTSPDQTVTLAALNLGPLATLTASPVTSSNGKGVISATYVGPNIAGLSLQLNAGSLTSAPASVNLSAAGVSVSLTPGQDVTISVGDITLSTGTATAILHNGAYGDVRFSVGDCQEGPTLCAGVKTEISLLGNFGDPAVAEPAALYSNAAPAEMDWGCNAETCKPTGFVPDVTTRYELQIAEYTNRPVMVQTSDPSAGEDQQPFVRAPVCSGKTTKLTTGAIVEPEAQKLGFCVDSGAISRSQQQCDGKNPTGDPTNPTCSVWAGNLTVPVLFVKDPRFMGS